MGTFVSKTGSNCQVCTQAVVGVNTFSYDFVVNMARANVCSLWNQAQDCTQYCGCEIGLRRETSGNATLLTQAINQPANTQSYHTQPRLSEQECQNLYLGDVRQSWNTTTALGRFENGSYGQNRHLYNERFVF